MFRRMRPRPGRQRLVVSPRAVDQWCEQLNAAADAELPPDTDRGHRARLLLELVDAMNRMEPAGTVPETPRTTPQAHDAATAPSPERTEPQPRTRRSTAPRHAMPSRQRRHRGGQQRSASAGRVRTLPRKAQAGFVAGAVLLIGLVAFLVPQSQFRPGEDGGPNQLGGGLTKIKVGVLPVVDVAPFYRALEAGYFTQEGLDVEAVTIQSGPQAVGALAAGDIDIAFTSYPGVLQARSAGDTDLKIIAPAYTALPGHLMLVAPPDGSIGRAEDVVGKRIAVTSTQSISDLCVISELTARQLATSTITWVQMAMPEMGPAMERGDVDGAVLAEPYITLTDNGFHARPILDIAVGKTARIPVSGWVARNQPDHATPGTAAFVQALRRAVDDVADRSRLDPILVKYLSLDERTARAVRIAEYTKDIEPAEIQRVADLMREFDMLGRPLDVRPMLLTR